MILVITLINPVLAQIGESPSARPHEIARNASGMVRLSGLFMVPSQSVALMLEFPTRGFGLTAKAVIRWLVI